MGMPPGRFGQSTIMAGDKLVLFGGINDHGVRHNDTWVGQFRDEGTASSTRFVWTHLNAGPTAPLPRGAHAGCCMGTQSMVIHGGIGPDGQRLGDTWLLDLSGGSPTWREVVPIMSPPPRSGHTLTWIGGTLMVLFGGRGSGYEVLNDMWILDIAKRDPDWVQVNASNAVSKRWMPQPRVGHSATLILGGRVLIYGGEDSQRRRKNDFWVLDPNVLPTVKSRSGDWMVKKMSGRIWKKLQVEGHPPDPRSFHRACTDRSGRFMYIFGGMVDRIAHPGESSGLRFDGRLYLAELPLNF